MWTLVLLTAGIAIGEAALVAVAPPQLPRQSVAGAVSIDEDERQSEPVAHRYVHGVMPDDAKFQLALPDAWNGKLAVVSRGFSGTEHTSSAWKTAVLQKGYAFAASDEGWNRKTIAFELEDSYFESRQRIRELMLYAQGVLASHYGRRPERTLIHGMLERRPPHEVDARDPP